MTAEFARIPKPLIDEFAARPNFDYENEHGGFDWQQIVDELDWLSEGGLNIAYEAIELHALNPDTRDKLAMIWEGKNGGWEGITPSPR